MGSLSKLVGMLPGMGEMKAQLDQVDDRELDRASAIIQSMTPGERRDPKVLNASRRLRIANGSGMTVIDVNSLVNRFAQAQVMMRQMRGGMPGMPGMPGARKSKGKQAPQKRVKGRSGNPAKRAEQERAAALGKPAAVDVPQPVDQKLGQLPDAFKNLLGSG
jgi:signal recognition particle subunit SRP54